MLSWSWVGVEAELVWVGIGFGPNPIPTKFQPNYNPIPTQSQPKHTLWHTPNSSRTRNLHLNRKPNQTLPKTLLKLYSKLTQNPTQRLSLKPYSNRIRTTKTLFKPYSNRIQTTQTLFKPYSNHTRPNPNHIPSSTTIKLPKTLYKSRKSIRKSVEIS